jgi:hypothetical protein
MTTSGYEPQWYQPDARGNITPASGPYMRLYRADRLPGKPGSRCRVPAIEQKGFR